MTQLVTNYAKVLLELGIEPATIKEAKRRYSLTGELKKAFVSPVISKQEKHKLIERIFDEKMHHFLKVLCDYNSMEFLPQILDFYFIVYEEENGILGASLYYVTRPSDSQLEKIAGFLGKRFGEKEVKIRLVQSPELVGGFILRAGNREFDWSIRGRFKRLEQKLKSL